MLRNHDRPADADRRGGNRAKFVGEGTVDVPFTCSWTNTTDSSPDPPDTVCPIANTTGWNCTQTCYLGDSERPLLVPAAGTNRTVLSATVFAEVPPTGYSCTIGSVLAPKWRVPWTTETPFWDATTAVSNPSPNATASSVVTRVSFNLQNVILGGFVPVAHADAGVTPGLAGISDPDRWFDCGDPRDVQPSGEVISAVTECKWLFDLHTGYFAIRQSWWCDDKDPGSP